MQFLACRPGAQAGLGPGSEAYTAPPQACSVQESCHDPTLLDGTDSGRCVRSGDRHVRFDGLGSSAIQAPPPPRAPHPAAPTCPGHATVRRQALASLGGVTPGREHGEKGAEEATGGGVIPPTPDITQGNAGPACQTQPCRPIVRHTTRHTAQTPSHSSSTEVHTMGGLEGEPPPGACLLLVPSGLSQTRSQTSWPLAPRLRRGPVLLHILSSVRKGDGRCRKRWSE